MQIIQSYPAAKDLHLPSDITEAIMAIISTADDNKNTAEKDWQEYPCSLFIFDSNDTNQSLECLDISTLYNLGFTRVSFGVQDYAEKAVQTLLMNTSYGRRILHTLLQNPLTRQWRLS